MLFDCEEVEATKAQMVEAKQVKKGRKPLPKPLPKVGVLKTSINEQLELTCAMKIPIIYSTDSDAQSKLPLNKFNLSNDKFYDSHYTGRLVRVRQTFGQLVVHHALPALKLHPAFVSHTCNFDGIRFLHSMIV